MKNFCFEMQDGALLHEVFSDDQVTAGAADQSYFNRCIYARVSSKEHHTVMLVDETGKVLRREHFYHPQN